MFATRLTVCLCVMFAVLSVNAAEPKPRRLVARLSGRSEQVRIKAIAEISHSVQQKHRSLPEMVQAANLLIGELEPDDKLSISAVALIYTIASVDRLEAEEAITELLDSNHPSVVLIAADALGKNKFYGAIEKLAAMKDHPAFESSYGFRFNLVRSLAEMEHPRAIEILAIWSKEIDGQLRHEIDKLMVEIVVDDFRGDMARFAAWQKTIAGEASNGVDVSLVTEPESRDDVETENPTKIKLFPASHSSDSPNRIRFSKSHQYYGIDIHAKRLMFVLDHSGSMEDYWAGMSRLERAKGELIRAIEGLDPRSEFAIMFYETNVRTWKSMLVLANDKNKREAIAFVRRLQYGDRTNTYGALKESIEYHDQLEAVFLLTDGRPTAGDIVRPAKIVADIMHRNRFRHLKFNTIGIAVEGTTEAFLQAIAEQSGGEYRSAN